MSGAGKAPGEGAMRLLLAALLFMLAAGCASARRGEPLGAPVRLDSAQEVRGEKAFMFFCDKCHPGGESGLGFALNNKPLPGPMIKAQVRAGLGAMPSFSKELLPADRLDDIVAYMKALRKR